VVDFCKWLWGRGLKKFVFLGGSRIVPTQLVLCVNSESGIMRTWKGIFLLLWGEKEVVLCVRNLHPGILLQRAQRTQRFLLQPRIGTDFHGLWIL